MIACRINENLVRVSRPLTDVSEEEWHEEESEDRPQPGNPQASRLPRPRAGRWRNGGQQRLRQRLPLYGHLRVLQLPALCLRIGSTLASGLDRSRFGVPPRSASSEGLPGRARGSLAAPGPTPGWGRVCGKPTCHCARGERHPSAQLSYRGPEGKTVGHHVPQGLVEPVREGVAAWHRFQAVARELAERNRVQLWSRASSMAYPPRADFGTIGSRLYGSPWPSSHSIPARGEVWID